MRTDWTAGLAYAGLSTVGAAADINEANGVVAQRPHTGCFLEEAPDEPLEPIHLVIFWATGRKV